MSEENGVGAWEKNLGVYLYGRRKRERPKKIFSPKPRFSAPFSSLCCCCWKEREGGQMCSFSFSPSVCKHSSRKEESSSPNRKKIFQSNNDDFIYGIVFAFKIEGEERSDGLNPSANSLPPTIQYFMLTFLCELFLISRMAAGVTKDKTTHGRQQFAGINWRLWKQKDFRNRCGRTWKLSLHHRNPMSGEKKKSSN